ncbi:hypothetical protein [Brevibacillus centrosporus]|uniref:hypothetical protein n=1 Tax=Brevibacillus centrosporus TaxID=54910 RepID=UPI0038184299
MKEALLYLTVLLLLASFPLIFFGLKKRMDGPIVGGLIFIVAAYFGFKFLSVSF